MEKEYDYMQFQDRESKRSSVVGSMITRTEETEQPTKKKNIKSNLVQKGYYLTPEIAQKVKLRAAQEGKKDYQIVQEALEKYLYEV